MIRKVLATIQEGEECCTPLAQPAINLGEADRAAKLFGVLADSTRLTILNMLAGCEGDVCQCDISESFKLGQPTISHHLKTLRDAGLITGDKRGKWVYYSLVPGKLEEVKSLLEKALPGAVPALR